MHRLSIIIPVLDGFRQMEETLVSVLENRPDDCQIVVVLNRPYADPYHLTDEVRFIQAPPAAGLACCANLGLCATRAPIVHLLISGAAVCTGWADAALELFDDPEVASVAPVILRNDDPSQVVSVGMGYYSSGSPYPLAAGTEILDVEKLQAAVCGPDAMAGFYRRTALQHVEGFTEEVGDRFAGLDAGLALCLCGYRCELLPDYPVFATPEMLCRAGAMRSGLYAERLFWRWAPQYGWARSLLSHGLQVFGESCACVARPSNLLRLGGRLLGSLQRGAYYRHWDACEERKIRESEATIPCPHFDTASIRPAHSDDPVDVRRAA